MARIKIKRIYQHPKTNAIIVHYEFDIYPRGGNINFPASMFKGFTEQQIKDEIWRHLEQQYEQKQREQEPTLQTALGKVVTDLKDKEKK